jgi:hypothetical protein
MDPLEQCQPLALELLGAVPRERVFGHWRIVQLVAARSRQERFLIFGGRAVDRRQLARPPVTFGHMDALTGTDLACAPA